MQPPIIRRSPAHRRTEDGNRTPGTQGRKVPLIGNQSCSLTAGRGFSPKAPRRVARSSLRRFGLISSLRVICVSVVKFPDYFLVFGICLALVASFFFWLSTSAFDCFCTACLLLAFGDLSPMDCTLRSEGTPINSEICAPGRS
jgi:hypothetical protein